MDGDSGENTAAACCKYRNHPNRSDQQCSELVRTACPTVPDGAPARRSAALSSLRPQMVCLRFFRNHSGPKRVTHAAALCALQCITPRNLVQGPTVFLYWCAITLEIWCR